MMATLVDVFGAFGLTVSEKTFENYELADLTCPRNADNIHHNGTSIPADDFLCLPRGRDYGKFHVVSRDCPPDPCGFDKRQPLSGGVVRPPHGFAPPKNPDGEV